LSAFIDDSARYKLGRRFLRGVGSTEFKKIKDFVMSGQESRVGVVYGIGRQFDDNGSPEISEAEIIALHGTGERVALLNSARAARSVSGSGMGAVNWGNYGEILTMSFDGDNNLNEYLYLSNENEVMDSLSIYRKYKKYFFYNLSHTFF
jgi:hypothetical protein